MKGENKQSEHLKKAHKRGWAWILALLLLSTSVVQENARHLQLNLLGSAPQHAPFDGTVYPLAQVPDWLQATADERTMTFNEFPQEKLIPLPAYTLNRLNEPTDSLEWGDPYDDYTRIMKLTYTVPYTGNYYLDDWRENVGSHPGADIKALNGTPVYAMANGVVERVSYSNGGFGNLIVLRHNDVPSPENAGLKTTLHSGYGHLQDIFVTDGAVVTKGQLIGTIGRTGTATTDHLHFQIDRDEAPWHLYWPFTSAEVAQAGLNFWSGVNEGLGLERLRETTIHPMNYVQKYLDPAAVYAAAPLVSREEAVVKFDVEPEPPVEPAVENETPVTPAAAAEPASYQEPFTDIQVQYEPYLLLREVKPMRLTLVDDRGEVVAPPEFRDAIDIQIEDTTVAQVGPAQVRWIHIINGTFDVNIEAKAPGQTNFSVLYQGHTYFTGTLEVPLDRKPLASFSLETDRSFFVGKPETIAIVALNEDQERMPNFTLDEPMKLRVKSGEGFFSRDTLTASDFERGIATVEFTATSSDDVVLAVEHPAYEGASALLATSLFDDLNETNPFYQAVNYLKSQDVIEGYEDNTFRPNQAVSRVEALKLIFAGLQREVVTGVELSFPDTESTAWYAPYVSTAQRDNIVKGYPDGTFKPANEVNRVEFMKMLTASMGIDVDPVVIGNPYQDVHYLEWYAPYAKFVKETNLSPWNRTVLEGGTPMTRGEVAEMIYRLLAMQKNGAERYSRTLVLN